MNADIATDSVGLEKVIHLPPDEAKTAETLFIDMTGKGLSVVPVSLEKRISSPLHKKDKETALVAPIEGSTVAVNLPELLDKRPSLRRMVISGVRLTDLEDTGVKNLELEDATLELPECTQDVVSWLFCRSPNLRLLRLNGISATHIAELDENVKFGSLEIVEIDLKTCNAQYLAWFRKHCPKFSGLQVTGFTEENYNELNNDSKSYYMDHLAIDVENCSEHILSWISNHFTSVRHLELDGAIRPNFTQCKTQLHQVVFVTLDLKPFLDEETARWVLYYITCVEVITLRVASKSPYRDMKMIIAAFERLSIHLPYPKLHILGHTFGFSRPEISTSMNHFSDSANIWQRVIAHAIVKRQKDFCYAALTKLHAPCQNLKSFGMHVKPCDEVINLRLLLQSCLNLNVHTIYFYGQGDSKISAWLDCTYADDNEPIKKLLQKSKSLKRIVIKNLSLPTFTRTMILKVRPDLEIQIE